MDDLHILPTFVPQYQSENRHAMDWGMNGIIAFASGCCVNFCRVIGSSFERFCTAELPSNTITCVKMYPEKPLIAVSDIKGKLFLYDFEKRKIIVNSVSQRSDACIHMEWYDDYLLLLTKSKKFRCISFKDKENSETKTVFVEWDMQIFGDYTQFSVDPHHRESILFSGASCELAMYKLKNIKERPEIEHETIQIYNDDKEIVFSQWSFHLPGFVFIVLVSDVVLLHTESKIIIPLITQRSVSESYDYLCQLKDDFSKIIIFQKSGTMTVLELNEEAAIRILYERQGRGMGKGIAGALTNPFNMNQIAIYHQDIGLELFDFQKERTVSILPIYPANVTAFDSDGEIYSIGTSLGFIMFGSTRAWNDFKRFKVSDKQISFISLDIAKSRIYFQSEKIIGYIDIARKTVVNYPSKGIMPTKCYGNHNGSFIVQRGTSTLGVFINGKEQPLLFKADIVSVAFDEDESDGTHGKFIVLLKNSEIYFHEYSANGVSLLNGVKPHGIGGFPAAFAICASCYVTAYENGFLIFYERMEKKAITVKTDLKNMRMLRFHRGVLYGLCGDSTFFLYKDKVTTWDLEISDYKFVSASLILARCADNCTRFIRIDDKVPLSKITKMMPIKTKKGFSLEFIEKCKQTPPSIDNPISLTQLGHDIWLILSNSNCLRLQAKCCAGEQKLIENMKINLMNYVTINNKELSKLKYTSLIFTDKFEEAADVISNNTNLDESMFNTMFSSTLYLLAQNMSNEKVMLNLKTTAMNLLENRRYEEGALIMRIGRMDVLASTLLIDYGEERIAMRFSRNSLNEEDKRTVVFRLGCNAIDQGKREEGVLFFCTSCEYHAMLYYMFKFFDITDTYYIMKFLEREGKLKEISHSNEKFIQDITPIEELKKQIESSFSNLFE